MEATEPRASGTPEGHNGPGSVVCVAPRDFREPLRRDEKPFRLVRFNRETKSGLRVLFDTFDSKRDGDGFMQVYKAIFAPPPWSLNISEAEAREQLDFLLAQRSIFFRVVVPDESPDANGPRRVLGYCAGNDLPERYLPLIAPHVSKSHRPVASRVFYEAKVGLDDLVKGNGLANVLMAERVRHAMQLGYEYVASRTLGGNDPIERIYQKFGYVRICSDPEHPERNWWLLDLTKDRETLEKKLDLELRP